MPFSRSRCYLSGMDWFVRAMDRNTRAATGIGNYSQIILALRGRLDGDALRNRLARLIETHPILAGRCRRHPLNLAPYWAIPRTIDASRETLLDEWSIEPQPTDIASLPASLIDQVNRPLPGRCRIGFSLAHQAQHSFLAMRFDHQVLDAVGAERLLQYLADAPTTGATLALDDRPAHLNGWIQKFKSGRIANRALLALRETTPPVRLPIPTRRHGYRPSRFIIHRFDETATRAIIDQSERHAGYLLLLPYLLGVCVQAFNVYARRTGCPGRHYVVPVTMNARRSGHGADVFFNRLSFHFYRFERASADNPQTVWKAATTQFYRQTRDRVADHVAQAGYLMRILPAGWLGRLMRLPLSGLGSFSFSLVNGNGFDGPAFMGLPVDQVVHLPRVPAPPGIGMYFTRYHGCLTLVLSYLEDMLNAAEARDLTTLIVDGLIEREST